MLGLPSPILKEGGQHLEWKKKATDRMMGEPGWKRWAETTDGREGEARAQAWEPGLFELSAP